MDKSKRVIVTRHTLAKEGGLMGICFMQVCAVKDATDEEILAVCEKENPCGTMNGWTRVIHKDDEHPEMNEGPCADAPERMHYLVSC